MQQPTIQPPNVAGSNVAVAFLVWIISLGAAAVIVRLGWEVGGKLWSIF